MDDRKQLFIKTHTVIVRVEDADIVDEYDDRAAASLLKRTIEALKEPEQERLLTLTEKLLMFNKYSTKLAGDQKKRRIFFLELLCRPADRSAIIGDLLEAYDSVLQTQGQRRADTWFRAQIFWTSLSLLWSRVASLPGIATIGLGLTWVGSKLSGG
jgi:hypothetical protein